MRVLVKNRPRSLALATDDRVLVFRYFVQDKGGKHAVSERPKVIVEFVQSSTFDLREYKPLTPKEAYGLLGIISIQGEVYLSCITHRGQVASPRPNETVCRIFAVEFFCLTSSEWDFVTLDGNGFAVEQVANGNQEPKSTAIEHPCANIRKLLSNGSFYYSTDFDLTSVLQHRGAETKPVAADSIDETFMWNSYMMSELLQFRSRLPTEERTKLDKGEFLTTAIRGFAGTMPVPIGRATGYLTIISRQSFRRAGTRFNVRGVDDEGNVANFVETETILCLDSNTKYFGYTQVRGSVPVFWEQDTNLLSAKISITRSVEATQPAFNRHFEYLTQKFGTVHNANLLALKGSEGELGARYRRQLDAMAPTNTVGMTEFDFHAEVSRGGYAMAANLIPRVHDVLLDFGFYSGDGVEKRDLSEQVGIFRTNCLDCLDRTNLVQQLLSKEAIELYFSQYGIRSNQELWTRHSNLWADNGDQLSQIYAGTNALKTSYTRSGKMGLAGAIADVTKSVGRMYINNFVDKGRQNTIDVLLGRDEHQLQVVLHDPINDYVTTELNRRRSEFSCTKNVKIFAGTFNLNGVMADQDLTPWLFPTNEDRARTPDVFLIGFQELVELTAQQILNTDPAKKDFWEHRVLQCLKRFDDYVLLRSGQLVGTALFFFAKKSSLTDITKVEGALKKTGLGGMTGNKGGVAVSFQYCQTSMCFVTAHLASGMSNVPERHQDYKTLSTGLRFSRGRSIKDHDTIIWLGDFNYRVEMANEEVRRLVAQKQYDQLLENDQLTIQMYKGETFPYYNEGAIAFAPTYKFDKGTNDYDTSEKQRTPSWTDRILSRGANIRQNSYGSAAGLLFSDHRPVYATFTATVLVVDEAKKKQLNRELYDKRRAEVGNTNDLINLMDLDEGLLDHGLPPPSTDAKKWWISGRQSAKVALNSPEPNMIINQNKLPNPFSAENTAMDDFIKPPLPQRPTSNPAAPTNSKGKVIPATPRKPIGLRSGSDSRPSQSTPMLPTITKQPTLESLMSRPAPGSRDTPPPPPPRRSRASSNSTASVNSVATNATRESSLLDDGEPTQSTWQALKPT